MRKKSFNNYLDRVGDLTVTQRETLLERLTKQTSQEVVHYETEKRCVHEHKNTHIN